VKARERIAKIRREQAAPIPKGAPVRVGYCSSDLRKMSPESRAALQEIAGASVRVLTRPADPSLLSPEEQAEYAAARQSVVDARHAGDADHPFPPSKSSALKPFEPEEGSGG
jgi:hypothetical protein